MRRESAGESAVGSAGESAVQSAVQSARGSAGESAMENKMSYLTILIVSLLASNYRCTETGYTRIYENVSRLAIQEVITPSERYDLIIAMRYQMCGKKMYATYEYGIERLK